MVWAAATSKSGVTSGAFRHLMLVWMALTTTLVFGFMTVRASAPAGAQFRVAGVDLLGVDVLAQSPTTTIGPGVVSAIDTTPAAPVDGPPGSAHTSIVYAGVRWSLVETRFVSVAESDDGFPVVIAELDVVNTTPDVELRVRPSDLTLVWPDGSHYEVDRFDQISPEGFSLEPGGGRSVTAVFKPRVLDDPVLDEMALELGEPGRIPARIPLSGPPLQARFPIEGAVAADSVATGGRLVIVPRRAVVGLNAGPYRAALGTRLVLAEVSVQRSEREGEAAFLQPDFWQLEVDGSPVEPSRITQWPTTNPNQDQVTLVFVVDEGFGEMVLRVAAGSPGSADYPIVFAGPVR